MMSRGFFNELMKDIHDMSMLIIFSRSHPVFKLKEDERRHVVNYFNLIKEKVDDEGNMFRKDVARHLIAAMICELGNAINRILAGKENIRHTRGESIFTDFIRLVGDNYKRERRVSWYSEQMCISPKYLSETVKNISGRAPNEWIDNYVTLELRSLLRNTTKSVKEIANEMNFQNQSFLGKYFKEHVGISPVAYRKNPANA
ncbi:dNA-binding helix-turn-helix protein [Prevotella sp. CAG:1058]|nr:dNA-binding helix-turn-helix protein [Prevotella sp. CAG:1058]